jgi:hypothetical protein
MSVHTSAQRNNRQYAPVGQDIPVTCRNRFDSHGFQHAARRWLLFLHRLQSIIVVRAHSDDGSTIISQRSNISLAECFEKARHGATPSRASR